MHSKEELQKAWGTAADAVVIKAVSKDWHEYSTEAQNIIRAEVHSRNILAMIDQDGKDNLQPNAARKAVIIESPSSSKSNSATDTVQEQAVKIVWEIKRDDGTTISYEQEQELDRAVLKGEINNDWLCRRIVLTEGSKRNGSKWKPVKKAFAVFHPIRACMWKGGLTGSVTAVLSLYLLTAVSLGSLGFIYHNPKLIGASLVNIFWFSIMLSGFASSLPASMQKAASSLSGLLIKGVFLVAVLSIVHTGIEVLGGVFLGFGGVFSTFILGSLLGGLPGLAIGSLLGLLKRRSLCMPPGTEKENVRNVVLLGILFPIGLFICFVAVYIKYILPFANQAVIDLIKK